MLLGAIDQAVIATDAAGKIAYWNDAAEAVYGWTKAEVRGRDVVEVVPAEISREEAAAIMKTIVAGEIWSGMFAVRDRNGRRFDAAVTDLPVLKDGKIVGVLGVSKADEQSSPLSTLLGQFADAANQLWPGQIQFDPGPGLDVRSGSVRDPHVLQLLALLVLRECKALDRGDALQLMASRPTQQMLAQFGLTIAAARCIHIQLRRSAREASASVLRDTMRHVEESRYAAALVGLAAGRLFIGTGPTAATATHLFLPVGI